jgi:ribosomal protein L3 glutamine methyltransferase
MTLIDYVRGASARLEKAGVSFGQGTTNAFDEAVWLVLWRLGLPLDDLDGVADRTLTFEEVAQLDALVDRRIAERRPAAYLTGEAWLQGVPFFVDERTIVPRSLIAEALAEGRIDPWLPAGTTRVLDLCTGNGSLAILAALAWPDVRVDAADLSESALAVAARNVERHGLQHRITLHAGDGFGAVKRANGGPRYDLVLCNPPYVDAEAMDALPPEFRAEPAVALTGGRDGMDFIRPMLAEAAAHLSDEGALVLEIGRGRAAFEAAFPGLEVVWLPTQLTDDEVLLIVRQALVAVAEARP